jgi:hypothetical protein
VDACITCLQIGAGGEEGRNGIGDQSGVLGGPFSQQQHHEAVAQQQQHRRRRRPKAMRRQQKP